MTTNTRSDMRQIDARENLREEPARLTRRRGITTDKFFVPDHLKKDDLSYEWKTKEVVGAPQVEHQVMLAENHWTPVPASEMPGLMPAGYSGAVERGGQILMSRPAYLTEEANQEVLDMSVDRVRNQERRLGIAGQGEAPRVAPKVSRNFAPLTKADRASVRAIPE